MIRYRRIRNYKLCRFRITNRYIDDICRTMWEIKIFRLRGEYGRKSET